jgi:hypothetical protein
LPSSDELARRVGTLSLSLLPESSKLGRYSETLLLHILELRFALDEDLWSVSFLLRLLRLFSILGTVPAAPTTSAVQDSMRRSL